MAYEGKFVDRSPCLRPAGQVKFKKDRNMVSCLTYEVTGNEVLPTVSKRRVLDYKLPPKKTNIYQGYFSDVRKCLQPETELGLFDVLKKEFSETVYDSYWNKEVGRVPDPTPMLPAGMDPMKECFGKSTLPLLTAGELINPPKLYTDVISESMEGHNMYKKSHQDYGPGEQINRNYVEPYNRECMYGKHIPCDPNGSCIKKVMDMGVEDNMLVSKLLADYKRRVTSVIGKVHAPNNNTTCVPKGHAFGKLKKRDLYGPGELLKGSAPSLDKIHYHQEISHVNILRRQIAKMQPPFPHRDFIHQFRKFDANKTGSIALQEAYKVVKEFKIFPNQPIFEALLMRLGILTTENLIDYEKMADLLNVNVEFPEMKKIHDVPSEFLSFETTSQNAYRYHNNPDAIKNTYKTPKAGKPLQQYIPLDSLIRPAHYAQYFLEAKDFFISRKPEYFRILLKRIGHDIEDEKFNIVWNRAKDKTCCVSVNSFFKALKDCQ